MSHPFAECTRKRLEEYVGTTETLTLEFKSCRALIGSDKKDRNARIQEAAKDVAAMANEQGGVIIYGIEESATGTFRRAVRVEEGFGPEDGVSREWFLQFIRERVHPPLYEIDAVDVPFGNDRNGRALVVLVPQSIGTARQTDDLCFWRRDAHGLRKMTVQEIEDVRSRSTRPVLDLLAVVREFAIPNSTLIEAKTQIRIANSSNASASFAVVTVGLAHHSSASFVSQPEWRWLETRDDLKIARTVLASGSSSYWSPITPGFELATQEIIIRTPYLRDIDRVQHRTLGLVRVDHDGGARLYALRLHLDADLSSKLRLEHLQSDAALTLFGDVQVPSVLLTGI